MIMKKILLVAAVLIGANAVGQNTFQGSEGELQKVENRVVNTSKTPTDTLDYFWNPDQPVLRGYTGGGYVLGNNQDYYDFNISPLVQGYIVDEAYFVEGVMVWVGYVDSIWLSQDSSSAIDFAVYHLDENALPEFPGYGEVSVPYYTLSDTAFAFATFTEPIYVGADYGIGMSIQNLNPMDTVGVVDDDMGEGFYYNWLYYPAGGWTVMNDIFTNGMDMDIAFFPIVDLSRVSIEESGYMLGFKVEAYPNPATELLNVRYELKESSEDVRFEMYNANGQTVMSQDLGAKTAGIMNNETIDVSELSSGNYFYSLISGKNRITSKLIIE